MSESFEAALNEFIEKETNMYGSPPTYDQVARWALQSEVVRGMRKALAELHESKAPISEQEARAVVGRVGKALAAYDAEVKGGK